MAKDPAELERLWTVTPVTIFPTCMLSELKPKVIAMATLLFKLEYV